ncbi:YcxB family protein [Actinomadura sp. 3N508]|uniref:YcxB family protein n=1 Tax=Actinomadura sp. 3N508 TaxID=3375153 RepID=UPI0037A0FE04
MNIGDGGITVSYEPTPDEALRAHFYGLKEGLLSTYIVVAGALVIAAFYCFYIERPEAVVVTLALAVAVPIAAISSARGNLRSATAHMCVPTTLRLTADGLECRTDRFTITMLWSAYSNVENAREFWVLYVGGFPSGFILKRAYNAEQLAQIEGLLAPYEQAVIPEWRRRGQRP